MERKTLVLAGDIGGTKTNLGLYAKNEERLYATVVKSYKSREESHIEPIIRKFLSTHPADISSACFGVAGPIVKGRCKTTNLPWEISEEQLKRNFGWEKTRLLNDLTATSLSIPLLKNRELSTLNKGLQHKGGTLALVAPGTGLGQGLVVFHQGRLVPVSSEGGHADFAPTSEDQIRLWRFLRQKYRHVSVERLLSGPGLIEIYAWVRHFGRIREPSWLKQRFAKEDPAKVITDCALENKYRYCVEALDHFIKILGAVAGNLALTGLATGGVYLCGGIPPKILSILKTGGFMKAFTDKGRFSDLLKHIPVKVILNQKAALLGAAACAFQALT
ncbi:MAG: glucokinase [Deltaproteobacteria bacterium]|nr:glucokinase [Deltaproteobacteria bacterium]